MPTIGIASHALEGELRAKRRFSFGYLALEPLAAITEALFLLVMAAASTLTYQELTRAAGQPLNLDFLNSSFVAAVTFVTLSYLTGSYEPQRQDARRASMMTGLKIWALTLAFLSLSVFLLKAGADFSRFTVVIFAGSGALAICGMRAAWPALVRRAVDRGLVFVSNVAVVRIGQRDPQSSPDASTLRQLRKAGLRPVSWLAMTERPSEADLAELTETIEVLTRQGRFNEIIIVTDRAATPEIEQALECLRVVPLPVRVVLDPVTRSVVERHVTRVGDLVLAEYQRGPFSLTERMLKRALDVAVAVVGLIMLSPAFLLVAVAIKLDSKGPVLFRQSRRGFGGKTFMILKFRSMTVSDNGAVIVQAKKDDQRVTRVGRILRRTSLDELPQLYNVLGGEMSIVGPRPHAVAHDDYYARFIEEYAWRHHAKPGLTGWAQVKGLRGETPHLDSMKARIEKDVWYINHWSIWLDIVIIMRTALVVLNQKTAY